MSDFQATCRRVDRPTLLRSKNEDDAEKSSWSHRRPTATFRNAIIQLNKMSGLILRLNSISTLSRWINKVSRIAPDIGNSLAYLSAHSTTKSKCIHYLFPMICVRRLTSLIEKICCLLWRHIFFVSTSWLIVWVRSPRKAVLYVDSLSVSSQFQHSEKSNKRGHIGNSRAMKTDKKQELILRISLKANTVCSSTCENLIKATQ